MKKHTFETRIFNFRLFIEGLKRLRVTTTALGIITIAFSALIPIVAMLNSSPYYKDGDPLIEEIKFQTLCVPASLAVLAAPIFFSVMFSFLQKRKQSDFFHAIPYTRTCVYLSFGAAALISICAIQLAAGAVAGILWKMVPYTTYDVGPYIGLIFTNLLGSFMLSAFMMLALCVSGTGGSSYILFLLFASLPRIVLAILIDFVRNIYVLDIDYWVESSPLSPLWFYPLASVSSSLSSTDYIDRFLFNPATILYSLVVSILIFAFAGFLYSRRHSEMAGNPAPGKKTQALFRILFTMPMALLMTTFIALDSSTDSSLVLVLFVLTALCYFLYELVTTKRASNMGKAIPGFVLVLGICILFGITAYFTPVVYIAGETVTPQKIESVSLPQTVLTDGSYGKLGRQIEIDDPEIITIVTNAYNRTKDSADTTDLQGGRYEVILEKNSGRRLNRRVVLSNQERQDIASRYFTLANTVEDSIIPDPDQIYMTDLHVRYGNEESTLISNLYKKDYISLLPILNKEFSELDLDARKSILLTADQKDLKNYGFHLTLHSQFDGSIHLYINDSLPKTRQYLLACYTDPTRSRFELDGTHVPDIPASDILDSTLDILQEKDFKVPLNINLQAQVLNDAKVQSIDGAFEMNASTLTGLLKLLRENLVIVEQGKDIPLQEKYDQVWYLHIQYDLSNSTVHQVYANFNMALTLSEEEVNSIHELIS